MSQRAIACGYQELAERLEWERDEAREQVTELRNSIRAAETSSKTAWERHTEKCVELAEAREQRDRLREVLESCRRLLNRFVDAKTDNQLVVKVLGEVILSLNQTKPQ